MPNKVHGSVVVQSLSKVVIFARPGQHRALPPCHRRDEQASLMVYRAGNGAQRPEVRVYLCTLAALTPSCMRTEASWGARRAACMTSGNTTFMYNQNHSTANLFAE